MKDLPSSLIPLARMTDDTGLLEHSFLGISSRRHGYCTDDNGRALGMAVRVSGDPRARSLAERYIGFLIHAHRGEGRFELRLGYDRRFTDEQPSDDANGRAIEGLARAAAHAPWTPVREAARSLFEEAEPFTSPYWRPLAHTAVGAADLVQVIPDSAAGWALIEQARRELPRPRIGKSWLWPEDRLGYSNGLLPDALLAIGHVIGDHLLVEEGLLLLDWLVTIERAGDHFSFTPVGGWAPGEARPAFDQQPIEAWALSNACLRAYRYSGEVRYRDAVDLAVSWFAGANDLGLRMWDPPTGCAFDGLEVTRVNRNRGAESTLALIGCTTNARTAGLHSASVSNHHTEQLAG